MNQAIPHAKAGKLVHSAQKSLWSKFIQWASGQEENRFLWLALGIVGHGCVFTIITMLVVVFTGNHFIFMPFAIAAMAMTVVSNLAALPTKYTIPIFFFSLLIDLLIIISSVAMAIGAA